MRCQLAHKTWICYLGLNQQILKPGIPEGCLMVTYMGVTASGHSPHPQTLCRHQGGHRGFWKAKESPKDGARPEGNPPPPPPTSPVGKDTSLKARAGGKAEQDPSLKLSGQTQASRM